MNTIFEEEEISRTTKNLDLVIPPDTLIYNDNNSLYESKVIDTSKKNIYDKSYIFDDDIDIELLKKINFTKKNNNKIKDDSSFDINNTRLYANIQNLSNLSENKSIENSKNFWNNNKFKKRRLTNNTQLSNASLVSIADELKKNRTSINIIKAMEENKKKNEFKNTLKINSIEKSIKIDNPSNYSGISDENEINDIKKNMKDNNEVIIDRIKEKDNINKVEIFKINEDEFKKNFVDIQPKVKFIQKDDLSNNVSNENNSRNLPHAEKIDNIKK